MKTFLAIIGVLALVVVVAVAALIFIGFSAIKPMTEEATAYVDEAVPAIAAAWDADELRSRASPELLEAAGNDDIENLMRFISARLGGMTTYDGATCLVVDYSMTSAQGEVIIAQCTADAAFEFGGGKFSVNVIKRDDAWKFLAFFVEVSEVDTSVQVAYTPDDAANDNAMRIVVAPDRIGLSREMNLDAGLAFDAQDEKIQNFK